LIARHRDSADVRGVLVVECVERVRPGFGNELFVGIRATREFGPVIAAGLGGIDTEYLADKMKPGLAVAKAAVSDTDPEQFLELFKTTAAYEILSGRARGRSRIVSDGELLRCFRAFVLLARRFCVDRAEEGPDVAQPRSVAVLGVPAAARDFGRIILQNVIKAGFPLQHTHVIKEDAEEIDGVACVPSIAELPEEVDLLVIAASSRQLPTIVRETIDSKKVRSAIMIPGGVGETEGSVETAEEVRQAIAEGRRGPGAGPVFMGPNSLGIVSRPACCDTLFIPESRLKKHREGPARRVALISQSGAFIVSRMSNLENLDPAFAISLGNQIDVTASDVLAAVGRRDDIDTVGVYVEGFSDLDGLELLRHTAALTREGKHVVFYRAGRTEPGRSAAAGHTASVAGDYDVCQAAAEQAGALVADTFKEFEQMLELCTALHDKTVGGVRVGAVSNAGFETVGMADAIQGQRYRVEIASLSEKDTSRLTRILEEHSLVGLVNPRNPLDITPMAADGVYEDAVRLLLESDDVDAIVVGVVPLTAALKTVPGELEDEDSVVSRLGRLFAEATKPMIVVVDSGPRYVPLVQALRMAGLPVFPSADQAIRSLGRYLCHAIAGRDL